MPPFPPDIHTHNPSRRDNAIISGSPGQVARWSRLWPDAQFSAGIHPWDTAALATSEELEPQLQLLEQTAMLPQVTAIGETGLDALRGAPLDTQEEILRRHIAISEKLGKPLILHIVRAADRLLHIRRSLLPTLSQPWIWHGFRGKPRFAQQFLSLATEASPAYISLGANFNPATARAVPADSLLTETDDSPVGIDEVRRRIDIARRINDPGTGSATPR